MNTAVTRRLYIHGGAAALTGVCLAPLLRSASASQPEGSATAAASSSFPSQDPALVKEIVGASHRDIERVRALLKASPRLANCAYDWGFGDWETPLGAASHTGRVEIAHLLLDHDARPDIFALAMLGQATAVAAMLKAMPALARARGPHGLTLMHHARAGGEESRSVVDLLASMPEIDLPNSVIPPSAAAGYLGTYRFGPGPDDVVEVIEEGKNKALSIRRKGGNPCRLFHLGENRLHPAGATDTVIDFAFESGRAMRLTITTPAPLITANRE